MSARRPWKLIVAGVAAAVVMAGGAGMTVLQLRAGDANEPGPPNIDTLAWLTERSDEGWLVRRPRGWKYQPYRDHLSNRFDNSGALISNVAYDFRSSDGATSFRGLFPKTLAAVHIFHTSGGPSQATTSPDAPFPLALESAARDRDGGPGGLLLRMPFVIGGEGGWSIDAWIGDAASARDAEIVRRIFSSFGFTASAAAGALTLEEQMIAHEIAESFRAARLALKGRPHTHEVLATDATTPAPCDRHRCGLVVFQITGGLRFRVLVDVTERRAISFG